MGTYQIKLDNVDAAVLAKPEFATNGWIGGGIEIVFEMPGKQVAIYAFGQKIGTIPDRYKNLFCITEIYYSKQFQRVKLQKHGSGCLAAFMTGK